MKAIVYHTYGSPDVLKLEEVEKPTPRDNEVLIKVHASSINDWDWGLLRGMPLVNRVPGLLKPYYKILGGDIAGRVEAVGSEVIQYQPGDKVFGDLCQCGWGGFAEYVCARENALALKPVGITFEEAAAVPQAAVLALHSLRYKRQVQAGQKVLINGAGGGAGSFNVQMAKLLGAEVTGVDSTIKLAMMRSIGADYVIDYTQEDFTKNGQRYDLIIDHAAHHSIFDYKRSLSHNGIYAMVGGSSTRIFQLMVLGPLISIFGNLPRQAGKKMGIMIHKPNEDLAYVSALLETGKLAPVIDRRYPLSEVPEAFRYFGEGLAKGKVVITV